MTRDVLLCIKSSRKSSDAGEADNEETEQNFPAVYSFRNGKHYVAYEEPGEDGGVPIRSLITAQDGHLEIQRRGPVQTRMVLDEGRKTACTYDTAYGSLLLGFETKTTQLMQEEDRIEISVSYGLKIEHEFSADCRVWIGIRSRQAS